MRKKGIFHMALVASFLFVIALITLLLWQKRRRDREQLVRYSITAEQLHSSLAVDLQPIVCDVRLPLDLLADPNTIPAARRIAPSELIADPSLIPRDREVIVYCTCPGDATSLFVINKARQLGFTRIKFLRGGLAAWRALGYPVEPYAEAFHLDVGSGPAFRN